MLNKFIYAFTGSHLFVLFTFEWAAETAEGGRGETERHSNWNCKVSLHIFWVCVRHGECHGNDGQKIEKYDICRRDGKKLNSCLWVNKKTKKSIIKKCSLYFEDIFSKLFMQMKVFMYTERD